MDYNKDSTQFNSFFSFNMLRKELLAVQLKRPRRSQWSWPCGSRIATSGRMKRQCERFWLRLDAETT